MPSAAEQDLTVLCRAMQNALKNAHWAELATLDQAIRECLMRHPKALLSERGLLLRTHLKRLHDQARVLCAEECERLRLLLQRHLQYNEGQSAYGRINAYTEDD